MVKKKSTATADILLQSIIARAANDDNYVVMASLDLSAAFDLVNVELLVKRLRTIGLPSDLIDLIRCWLDGREFYVEVNGTCSSIYGSSTGTVQGSVLGPVLYALFVSPLFDLTNITNFADDNFIIRWNRSLPGLIVDLEKELEMICKWLRASGLVVNSSKTELCLFHPNDQPVTTIRVCNVPIKCKKSMNVLGVSFDSKLNWSEQVSNAIAKSNKTLYAIKMIKRFFKPSEIKILLNTHFYPVLYYNSEIWLTPYLQAGPRQQLLAASANALRSCLNYLNPYISYEKIHLAFKKSTPDQMALYIISLLLYKSINMTISNIDWSDLNFQMITTSRQTTIDFHRSCNYKIGNNILTNKFVCIKKKFSWISLTFHTPLSNTK